MSPSNSKPAPEFQYPPVQADRSLTSLDLDTLMMKSTTRRLPEQSGSSLDESTYEMLTDSLIETSDDEAHTASIASTSDDPTPDDASAFSDDDDDDDFEHHDRPLDESTQSMHGTAAHDDLETPVETSGVDSMLTMVPDHLEHSGGSTMLQLEEEPIENAESSLGTTVLRTFPTQTQELPKVLEIYGQTQVRVVVKAALSPQYISTPESYKILFVGLPEKWVQDDIIAHIHAALKASPSNTRSVMVRGQMEPLGTVIDAQSCAHIEIHGTETALPSILFRMDNRQCIKIQRQRSPRFDLVILCYTQKRTSATNLQTYESLRSALGQHQIPLIELTDIKPYGAGARTYDMRSLAACLEGRSDDEDDFELLEVLPLDTYNFCELEPAQINRHLALISPHLAPSAVKVDPKRRVSAIAGTLCAIGKQMRTGAPATTKVLLLSLALTAMLSAFVLSPVYIPLVLQKPTKMGTESSTIPVISSSSQLVTPPAVISSSVVSNTPPSSLSVSVPMGLTVVPLSTKEPKPKQDEKKETLSGFNIQTAGEKQFVLTPSRQLASSRKKPQLQIQVFRNTTLVPIRYVRTISGEYFVDLEDEHPFSTFNVSIASYSKPLVRQSFEVNLGHNKTWFDQMLGATTKKVMDTQSIIIHISSTAAEQVQARLSNVVRPRFGQLVEEGRQLEQAAYDSAKNGLEISADFVKHVPQATWTHLRKATAPIRLSQTVWTARLNALRVRCNVEIATGRLLKLSKEGPSRACLELRSHIQEKRKA